MWSLCHHVVSFIVIQRGLIKWIVIFAIIPATLAATNTCTWYRDWYECLCFLSFQSAHGQEFEWSISEHQDSVEKSFIQKCESPFKGCDPTVLFITDAASYHRRSCQAALWLPPHLRLRRGLICLLNHTRKAGVSVSCSYPSDIRPPRTASLSIRSIH